MIVRTVSIRPSLSTLLAALLFAATMGVPLLDRGASPPMAWDSQDAPAERDAHDHRICVQYGATPWLAGVQASTPPVGVELMVRSSPAVPVRPRPRRRLPNQPRAPPRL